MTAATAKALTMLRWSGYTGQAKLYGVSVALDKAPNLGSGPVWTMDYRPADGVRVVQPRSIEPPRDMEPHEIAAADNLLKKLTDGVPYDEPFDGLGAGDGLGDAQWLR